MKTLLEALDLRFDPEGWKQITIRDYLCKLLVQVWSDGESFSGKRPFGYSGWERSIYKPLVMNGFIEGTYDEEYDETSITGDESAAHDYVNRMIRAAFYGVENDKT